MRTNPSIRSALLVVSAIVVALPGEAFSGAAQQVFDSLGAELVAPTITDRGGVQVALQLPASLHNAQCERRIYGTPPAIGHVMPTLYDPGRRQESYAASIRELCLQPLARETKEARARAALQRMGFGVEAVDAALVAMRHGALAIDKRYVSAAVPGGQIKNQIAHVGRNLNQVQQGSAFGNLAFGLAGASAGLVISDTVMGALVLQALATDLAIERFGELEEVIRREQATGRPVDPALVAAMAATRVDLAAMRGGMGALAVSVAENQHRLADATVALGAAIVQHAGHLSHTASLWLAGPLMTYATLRGISDQWVMAQDAVTLVTLTMMAARHGFEDVRFSALAVYGAWAFHQQMEQTFRVGGAQFADMVNQAFGGDAVNRDLAAHHRQQQEVFRQMWGRSE